MIKKYVIELECSSKEEYKLLQKKVEDMLFYCDFKIEEKIKGKRVIKK